jgi:hypothetical protein
MNTTLTSKNKKYLQIIRSPRLIISGFSSELFHEGVFDQTPGGKSLYIRESWVKSTRRAYVARKAPNLPAQMARTH